MKKGLIVKRALLRKVLNILGVCTVGLVAACAKYGAEVSTSMINLKGTIMSKDSLKTIENIKVNVLNGYSGSSVNTDENGEYSIHGEFETNVVHIGFYDNDGDQNGHFLGKDTAIYLSPEEMASGAKPDIEIQLDRDE